jgi:hypothetical protein
MSYATPKLKRNRRANVAREHERYNRRRAMIRDFSVQRRPISSSLAPRARSISPSEAEGNV